MEEIRIGDITIGTGMTGIEIDIARIGRDGLLEDHTEIIVLPLSRLAWRSMRKIIGHGRGRGIATTIIEITRDTTGDLGLGAMSASVEGRENQEENGQYRLRGDGSQGNKRSFASTLHQKKKINKKQ